MRTGRGDDNAFEGVVDAQIIHAPAVKSDAEISIKPGLGEHDEAGSGGVDFERGGVAGKPVVAGGGDRATGEFGGDFAAKERIIALHGGEGAAVARGDELGEVFGGGVGSKAVGEEGARPGGFAAVDVEVADEDGRQLSAEQALVAPVVEVVADVENVVETMQRRKF